MKYLSQIREELPLDCLFNKVRVGCGGTTLALTNSQPYVIAVPYVALVDNKIEQNKTKHWLGVVGGVNKLDIHNYLNECEKNNWIPKILTTYDSLPKVVDMIDPQDFYLLVDEYHILFQQYSFRYDAIRGVLDNYKKFKHYTFMTATPIEPEKARQFVLTELQDVPYVEQDWSDDNCIDVFVEAIQCASVKSKVADIIMRHLSGDIPTNAYFFVNSLTIVNQMFDLIPQLNSRNTRVIYSANNTKYYQFDRGFTYDKPKKINFLTSTAFEGCDIYDEEGVTYIVSDANRKHTLLDISSSVQQIIGRIRDSKYRGRVVHIFSRDRYVGITPKEFEEKQEFFKKECARIAEEFNKRLTKDLTRAIKQFDDEVSPYTVIRQDRTVYDENLATLDLYQYTIRNQYSCKSHIEESYKNIGAEVAHDKWLKTLKDLGIFSTDPTSFKDAVLECRKNSETSLLTERLAIKKYEVKFPILRDAIEKLGYEKIETLRYVQRDIKKELIAKTNAGSNAMKIVSLLNFTNGQWVSSADIKKKMQEAFNILGIDKTAKATLIDEYYFSEFKKKRVAGKPTDGYNIFFPKHKKA